MEESNEYKWWEWQAASGAAHGRWHIIRYKDGPGITGENYSTKSGARWTCKNSQTAFRKAKELNNVKE